MIHDYYRYGSQNPHQKIVTREEKRQNQVFSLIYQLEKELEKIVEGSDQFLLTVSAARAALRRLKKFF